MNNKNLKFSWASKINLRGIIYDTRWQMATRERFEAFFKFMERLKYNALFLYIEDAFKSKKYPHFAATYSLTHIDIKKLVQMGLGYGIEIIPCFQSLGHATNILKCKEYKHLGETEEIKEVMGSLPLSQFCPSKKETLEFMADIYGELSELFPSSYFNICCDESFALGTCPRCKEIVTRRGKGGLYADYVIKLHDILSGLGKQTLVWSDMLLHYPEGIEPLPRDIIIVDWHYPSQKEYPSIDIFMKKGFRVITCTAVGWERNYPDTWHRENVKYLTMESAKKEVFGIVHAPWELYCYFLEDTYYLLDYAAHIAWHGKSPDIGSFNRYFVKEYFGIDDHRISGIATNLSLLNLIKFEKKKRVSTNKELWDMGWMHPPTDNGFPWQFLKKRDFLLYAYFNYQWIWEKSIFDWLEKFHEEGQHEDMVSIAAALNKKIIKIQSLLNSIRSKKEVGRQILEAWRFSCLMYQHIAQSILLSWALYNKKSRDTVISTQAKRFREETLYMINEFEKLWSKRRRVTKDSPGFVLTLNKRMESVENGI